MAATCDRKGSTQRPEPHAADTGVTVFRAAHARWIADGETREMADLQRTLLAQLRTLVTAPATEPGRASAPGGMVTADVVSTT